MATCRTEKESLAAREAHGVAHTPTHTSYPRTNGCKHTYTHTHARTYVDDFHLEIFGRIQRTAVDVNIQGHGTIASDAGDASRRRRLYRARARTHTHKHKTHSARTQAHTYTHTRTRGGKAALTAAAAEVRIGRSRARTRPHDTTPLVDSDDSDKSRGTPATPDTHALTHTERRTRRPPSHARPHASTLQLSLSLLCERDGTGSFGTFTTIVVAGGRGTRHLVTSREPISRGPRHTVVDFRTENVDDGERATPTRFRAAREQEKKSRRQRRDHTRPSLAS